MNAVTLGSRAVAGRKVAARKASVAARPARANVVVRAAATERKFNFSAGPACLPLDVLEEMKEDLVNYKCVFPAFQRTTRAKCFRSRPIEPVEPRARRVPRARSHPDPHVFAPPAAVDIYSRASETRPRR